MKQIIIFALIPIIFVLGITVKYLLSNKTPAAIPGPQVITEYIEVPVPGVCPAVEPKIIEKIKRVEVPMECAEAQMVAYYKKLISELKTKNQRLTEDLRLSKMTGFDNPYKHSK